MPRTPLNTKEELLTRTKNVRAVRKLLKIGTSETEVRLSIPYKNIVTEGKKAVISLIRYLEYGDLIWRYALEDITGLKFEGKPAEVCEKWIEWGKLDGYCFAMNIDLNERSNRGTLPHAIKMLIAAERERKLSAKIKAEGYSFLSGLVGLNNKYENLKFLRFFGYLLTEAGVPRLQTSKDMYINTRLLKQYYRFLLEYFQVEPIVYFPDIFSEKTFESSSLHFPTIFQGPQKSPHKTSEDNPKSQTSS